MIDLKQFANNLIRAAISNGADEADVYIDSGRESQISTRKGSVEQIKESSSQGFGLRVFKNKQLGFTFSSDFSKNGMVNAALNAVSMAGVVNRDDHNGLPEITKRGKINDLDLYDQAIDDLSVDKKIDYCKEVENAAFEYDKRIFNTEGAYFIDGSNQTVLANSNGICDSYKSSYAYVLSQPVAKQDDKFQANSWFDFKKHLNDLDKPTIIGEKAAERTVRMLGAKVVNTTKIPKQNTFAQ